MTDKPQEPRDLIQICTDIYYECETIKRLDELTDEALDWHNKKMLELLDRLDKSMPTVEQLTTKYGYHMPEKMYGYKLGLHEIRGTIEAERKKL